MILAVVAAAAAVAVAVAATLWVNERLFSLVREKKVKYAHVTTCDRRRVPEKRFL